LAGLVVALVIGLVPSAKAQETDEALVEALVVNARTPGPAWWSVSKGEAKVWVLGLAGRIPADTVWDARAFERRVTATRRLLYSGGGRFRLWKWAVNSDGRWAQALAPEERERLSQWAIEAGKPAWFYVRMKPTYAAMMIRGDIGRAGDAPRKPVISLMARAGALGAELIPINGEVPKALERGLSEGSQRDLACIRWVLSTSDQDTVDRAQAWARGDVRALVSRPMSYDPCVQSMRVVQASLNDNETALADEVARTLDGERNAVALIGLVPLLRQGGVLDQLRKRGYSVETPAQLEEG
jgi:hypothetical protein